MSDRADSFPVRTIQYAAVGIALSVLFILAQTLTSASEELHADRAREEFREGRFAENRGDCASAIEHYRVGLELADDPAYRLALARCLVREDRTSEGDTYLSQVLAADPTSGEANLLRAELLARAGAVDDAVLYYERATSGSWPAGNGQGRYRARTELVELLYAERRWRDLLPQLLQVRENPAVTEEQRVRIARMFLDAGAPDESRDTLLEMTRAGVQRADVQLLLGRAHLALRIPRQAATALRTALRLAPDDSEIARQAGYVEAIVAHDPDGPGLTQEERRRREVALGRVAIARMQRCAPFEQSFAAESAAAFDRAGRRGAAVESARLREWIAMLWERSGPSCEAQSDEERALEYLLPGLQQQAEAGAK